MAIELSGVNRWLDPSIWLRNVTPSSSMLRLFSKEKTWYPPESVKIGLYQPINLCRPPISLIKSSPGRRYRWYVLDKISAAFTSLSCAGVMAFTDAWVPTGAKMGVFSDP